MDTIPTDALIGAASATTCTIKVKPENNKQVMNVVSNGITMKLTQLSYGLMNKDNIDNMLSDELSDSDMSSLKE